MTDHLPTAEDFTGLRDLDAWIDVAGAIVAAWVSGRLVDREAIDYEAAARDLVRQIVLPANAERYVRQEAPVIVANSVVAAAIGDTDEERFPDTGPEDEPWGPGDAVIAAMDFGDDGE